jgi:hypothetical protein
VHSDPPAAAEKRPGAGHDEEAMLVEERLDVTGHCVAHIKTLGAVPETGRAYRS